MSNVYLALDTNLNKQWAVKEILKDKDSLGLASKEAYLMKNLDYPTLPRIVEISENEEYLYIVMDYIEGISLQRVVNEKGRLPEKTVIEYAKILCDTLIYLHDRSTPIIHRDLKPSNIIADYNGNIKLIDFGIARIYKEGEKKDTVYLGTKGYAAPEQFKGEGQTDEKTDIYSLGVTLYTLLTGKDPSKPPYEIYPIRKWDESLSAGLEAIIQKATLQDPKKRYKNAKELKYYLQNIEEEDRSYVLKQYKKLKGFLMVCAISLCFFGAGIIFLYERNQIIKNDYETYISTAKTATNINEKEEAYLTAINIRKDAIEPYMGLIDTYKEDSAFSTAEEETLIRSVNMNITGMKQTKDYGVLAYSIGKLYWYYYDYGKPDIGINITGIKNSYSWFEEAIGSLDKDSYEYNCALIYKNISGFNKNIINDIEEANDYGKYKEYYEALEGFLDSVSNENNEMIKLMAFRLCTSSIEMYFEKFIQDGVGKNEISGFFTRLYEDIDKASVYTESSEKLKEQLINRRSILEDIIERWG